MEKVKCCLCKTVKVGPVFGYSYLNQKFFLKYVICTFFNTGRCYLFMIMQSSASNISIQIYQEQV